LRVLITGGAGFIGSNLVHALVGRNDVCVIDDLSTGRPGNIHPATLTRTIDILDQGLEALVTEFAPEAVVHLAAQSSVPRSIEDPDRDRAVNVEGTRAVATAAARAGARRVISASSAAVYGKPAGIPLTECSRTEPISPYGASKLDAETVLAEELTPTEVDFASLRFSNVYGPRQDAEGEGGVVAVFCSALASGQVPVVHGTGRQTRDFIYVGDVVAAIMAAVEFDGRLCDAPECGSAYNISTGMEVSVEELASVLRHASGFSGEYGTAPERPGDIARSSLDPGKARDVLDWEAGVSLESGLALTYRWFTGA